MDKDAMQQFAEQIGDQLAIRINVQLRVFSEAVMARLDSIIEGQQTLADSLTGC